MMKLLWSILVLLYFNEMSWEVFELLLSHWQTYWVYANIGIFPTAINTRRRYCSCQTNLATNLLPFVLSLGITSVNVCWCELSIVYGMVAVGCGLQRWYILNVCCCVPPLHPTPLSVVTEILLFSLLTFEHCLNLLAGKMSIDYTRRGGGGYWQ